MSDPIVGIDLGTTNSVVAVADEAGDCRVLADERGFKIQPSVVSFHPNGSVVVGAEAKQRRIIDPRNTVYSAKRLIGRTYTSREVTAAAARMPFTIKQGVNEQPVIATRGGEFAVPEISAIVLDHMRSIARRSLDADVSRAVVTVPANFTDAQRAATATAGAIAGLTIVRVLNEPTAAALAYGHRRRLFETIAVYDFGGGTFDVTVLRLTDSVFEVLGTAGDSFLGGDDLDERLVDLMVERFLADKRVDLRANESAMQRLRQVAEQTKIQLSRRARAIIKIDEIAYGPGGTPLDLELEVTRDELVARVADIVERTFPVCQKAIDIAGLRPADIDDVVLVGGTTKMPLVRERVAQFFGKTPRTDVNPDEAVAVGAALQAQSLERILSGPPKRPTMKTAVAPPAPPLGARPPTSPGPLTPGRVTAPRFATAEPTVPEPAGAERVPGGTDGGFDEVTTGVHGDYRHPFGAPEPDDGGRTPQRRNTAPQGFAIEQTPQPITTERRARPGQHHDVLPSAEPDPKAVLARIRPAGPPPIPSGAASKAPAAPPVPTAPSAPADGRTLMGVPAAPGAAPLPEPTVSFKDVATDVPTTVRDPGAASEMETLIEGLAPSGPAGSTGDGAPMVIDVTPHSLGIATVAGYCEGLITRNARVPTQIKRVFSTSKDQQQMVRIRVCQGESRRLDENVVLGDLVLNGLEARPRGQTRIEVTFMIDESGMLRVRARDAETGQEQRADLSLLGAQTPDEVAAARDRLRAMRG